MDLTPKEYQQYVEQKAKKSPIVKDTALAFVIGGLICVLGQAIQTAWGAAGLGKEDAGTATSCTLVFLSALLTGLNLWRASAARELWCRSPVLQMPWSPLPSTLKARDLSPAWRQKCLPWPDR